MIALLESILHFLTALLDLAGDFVTGVGPRVGSGQQSDYRADGGSAQKRKETVGT